MVVVVVVGGGGLGFKKEKKEVGKKGEGIGERRRGTPAMLTSANSDWLIRL